MFSLFDDPSPLAKYRFSFKIGTKYTSLINGCTKHYSKTTTYKNLVVSKLNCILTLKLEGDAISSFLTYIQWTTEISPPYWIPNAQQCCH